MEQEDRGETQWIAIVGMSGRFPGARSLDQFWDNLINGRESISRIDRDALLQAGVDPVVLKLPGYVPAAPILEDVDQFDADFFGVSPREASDLAPAMRMFMECCWEAFENAGYVPGDVGERVGVYAGANRSTYGGGISTGPQRNLQHILGNDQDYLATHVSYKLNLKGPSISVQTACSTSLVAVHMAAQALLTHQCDLALAGGSTVRIPQLAGYVREEDSILSPDGHCRPFDAAESGPVFGSGVGVVLLKRLDEALADGDCIRAVIRGSAVNNDGSHKAGFTAPSAEGQAAVIALAQALADTPARAISYVEAHGTGTNLGDPIEVAALSRAFRLGTSDRGFCALGSVKGNVGHLETAAGIAGLVKTVLALEHREIPPSLHFQNPNPEIDFATSPFFVNTIRRPWAGAGPRLAGVSSFGMGGTNAHIVLEEAPSCARLRPGDVPQLLTLSARNPDTLERMCRNLADHLRRHTDLAMSDVAFTLGAGRARFDCRHAIVCGLAEESDALAMPVLPASPIRIAADPRIGLSLGDGGVPAVVAHQLYRDEPCYRRAIEACIAAGAGPEVSSWFAAEAPTSAVTAPLLFAIQYAVAELLRGWGIRPALYVSHGGGETVAAGLCGLLPLQHAIWLAGPTGDPAATVQRLAAEEQPAAIAWQSRALGRRVAVGERLGREGWNKLIGRSAIAVLSATEREGADLWIELGANSATKPPNSFAVRSMPIPSKPYAGRRAMLALAGELWIAGVRLDWRAVAGDGDHRRVALPTYPFDRKRFWSDEADAARAAPPALPIPSGGIEERESEPIDPERIRRRIREIIGKALRMPPEAINPNRDFIDMGADSLVLIESIQAIRKLYGIRLAVRDIFEKLTNIDALSDHIEEKLRAGGGVVPVSPITAKQTREPATVVTRSNIAAPRWGVVNTEAEQLDERQRRHLDALIARYCLKTAGSKRIAAENRAVLADVRMAAGFKLLVKEMLYPIVVERSERAHVIDVDGNDYVDVTMGFGVHLFGHKPGFLTAALQQQLDRDAPLGPENRDSGAVARLVCELAGVERAAFFNTGTEAVMTAIRLVRARSKRNKIVLFKGSYHGHADLTLGIGLGDGGVAPLSAGIPPDGLQHLMILDYGSEEALRTIEEHADELAAVLVEPVQSRYPDRQPAAFLGELRRITEARGIALVFDEMITGFRIAAGGAQAWFGVEADVVTYGKIVGGGMPIGVVAGKAAWLDYLDGGNWQYGDDSYPASETIFYAGTFNKNPWTMAAARATLEQIGKLGPTLYTELNRKTAYLAGTLNSFFDAEAIPIEVVHFASLFRFAARGNADLFFFHMIERGIYVWEGRNCFLSDAHSDADVELIIEAAKSSVMEMRSGGFIEAASPSPRKAYPLTEAQRQLLLLGDIAPDGLLAYNIHLTATLTGQIDAAAIELAVNGLVRRHEALRTTFPAGADHQEILPALLAPLARIDYSELTEAEREQAFASWFDTENHRSFDLAHGPLLRVHLLRFGPQDHRLVLALPHIIGDGISLNVLLDDLIALYNAERTGRAAALAPAPQFSEYVAWLGRELDEAAFRAHESYFLELLAGPLPVLGLPLDYPRPAVKRYDSAVASVRLDGALARQLKDCSQRHQATPFMTCLAAYLMLLHRITGDEDIVIGVPTSGRAMEGSETLVGYLTHLLPICSRLTGNPEFRDYLKQVKGALLDAMEHQDYPFANLLQKLDLPRDPSRSPLLSATFNMDQPPALPSMGAATVTLTPPPVRFSSFELAMNVTDLGGTLVIECKYHSSLFSAERIALLLEQYRSLLMQIADSPEHRVFDFDLVHVKGGAPLPDPAVELPQPDYPLPCSLILARAAEAPERPALRAGGRVWSYGEVAEQAIRWARLLQERGIVKGDRVAIEGPRDGRLVCCLIGVWLAGGVFVTIDDSLPAARRRTIVALSQARLLINLWHEPTESSNQETVVWHQPPHAVLPDPPGSAPLPELSPEDAAYLFFTSGTTGVPKGIVGLHKGVAHFVDWQRRRFDIGPDDRVAQLTALSFDALLRELFLPLASGGTLHFPDLADLADAARLLDWLAREKITVIHTVPSRARNWVAAASPGDSLPALRRVFFSGEPLTRSLVDSWRSAFGSDALLVNFYGSTETTMIKCYREIEPAGDAAETLGSILPMSDTQVLVLRGAHRCGVGELGEIVIRTPFRTAGYLEGGAAAAFAENPYRPGDVFYRSGDQGRYRPDGSVEVLGRLDDQIKVRGIRVQPFEVKSVLDTHPAVQNSVVIARPAADGNELIAYVVPTLGHERGLAETLRGFLTAQLPLAQVPRTIELLPALPLLPNGKVDRHALPEPMRAADRLIVEPRDDIQARLLSAWREILNVKPISVRDDFFELGGNSLSATRIASRIRTDFGVELPLKTLFEHRTVEALAQQVSLIETAAEILVGNVEIGQAGTVNTL
jgi:amino acid adenylation domain-containing protein